MPSSTEDFQISNKLGSGSFGVVYKVTRKQDKKVYVMKTINIKELGRKEQEEAINEVKILASLDNQYVVRYYDSFVERGTLHIVMSHCDRGDLQRLMTQQAKNGRMLGEEEVWSLFLQILLGLHYIHSKHILHRDIKTANVFLCKGDKPKVKIGDLGVARVMSSSTTFANTLIGTPYYLSPELCEDKPYNSKSGIWAIGVILYELCTGGQKPFEAQNQRALILKIVRGKYIPLKDQPAVLKGGYSNTLTGLVSSRLLVRDPNKRLDAQALLCMPQVLSKVEQLGLALPESIEKALSQKRQKMSDKKAEKVTQMQKQKERERRRQGNAANMPQSPIRKDKDSNRNNDHQNRNRDRSATSPKHRQVGGIHKTAAQNLTPKAMAAGAAAQAEQQHQELRAKRHAREEARKRREARRQQIVEDMRQEKQKQEQEQEKQQQEKQRQQAEAAEGREQRQRQRTQQQQQQQQQAQAGNVRGGRVRGTVNQASRTTAARWR